MRLPKDLLSGNYKKPRIFLCEVDKERICQLETTNTSGTFKFNSYSEITFDVDRLYNNVITGETNVNPHYNKIESPRLIEIENIGYFELQGPELSSDGIQETKSCTAYSLEYSLSTKYLTDFIINTGETGSVEVTYAEDVVGNIDDIQPVTLYNPTVPALSLLHLALQPIRGWRIDHVDTSLQTLSRTFEIDRESVYDFLINEVCEKFNCYIIFDTTNNTISVYAESLTAKFIGDGATNTFIISPPFAQIGTVSVGGYKTTRWEYNTSTGALALEDTPESGSYIEVVDGALTEWETDVFVSFENLAQELNINYDADAIKTQLTVSYGDDGNIREANFGLPYLIDISYYYTVDWMGQELYDAYTAYMQKSNGLQSEYTNNSQEISIINDQIYYEETRLSLEFSVVNSVNSTTVGTYYVKQGEEGNYYYKEVFLPGEYDANETYYSNATVNVTEEKMTNLFSVFKKYFHNENDDGDKITSWKTDLNKLSDDFKFMKIYTIDYLSAELSKVSKNRTDENTNSAATTAINNFLSEVWSELGRTPLQQLYLEPYKKIQATNIEAGWSNVQDEKYGYYYPVLLMINSIEAAITIRDNTIADYENQRTAFYDKNNAISDSLSMDNEANFSEEQLIRLSAFLREDELHLDDIVETSEDNLSSSFKVKQDAMESGRIELQKLCQPQLQFSMSMANIYALPEFEPIIDQFQLGKVIKVALRDDYVKQSRLLQVDINFDDFSDFSCEFGDLTNLRTQSDIHADLLKNAITAGKSVATNSGRWTKGTDTVTSIDLKIQQGLLDANTQIKAIDGTQGVVIDKYGIWLKKKDENGNIDPHQTRLVNNMIIMSDDGFKTSKTALSQVTVDGKSYYGLISEIMLAGYIEGTTIRGGTIDIGEYIENNNTKYHFAVDKKGNVTSDGRFYAGKYIDGDGNIQYHFKVDEDNKVTIGSWKLSQYRLESDLTASGGYRTGIQCGTKPTNAAFYAGTTTPSGGAIASASASAFFVRNDGYLHASNANITGTITATEGSIAIFDINENGMSGKSKYGDINIDDDGILVSGSDGHVHMYGNWIDCYNAGITFASKSLTNPTLYGHIDKDGVCGYWDSEPIISWSGDIYAKSCSLATELEVNGQLTANGQLLVQKRIKTTGQNPRNDYYYVTYINSMNRFSYDDTKRFIEVKRSDEANDTENFSVIYYVDFAGNVKCQTCTDSDERLKYDITNLSEQYSMLFDNLRPVTFKYKHGDSGRAHTGLIAQEVKSAMEMAGLSDKDFAAYVREITDDEGLDGYSLALRYSEFIALLINEVQKLKEKVHNLEKETSPQ